MPEESGENGSAEAPTAAQNPQAGGWQGPVGPAPDQGRDPWQTQPEPQPQPPSQGPDPWQTQPQPQPPSQSSATWNTPQQLPPLQPPPLAPGPMPGQAPAQGQPMPPPGQMPVPPPGPQLPSTVQIPGQQMPGQTMPGQPMPSEYYGGYPTLLPGQLDPAAQPPTRKRRPRWLLIGVPVLVIALAAGAYGVVRLLSSPNPDVTKVRCLPQSLSTCLVAAPGGANTDTSAWGKSVSVSSDAYASQFADQAENQQPEVGGTVAGDGVKKIVHREWTFGSDQVDIILLQFHTIQGAKAWAQDRSGEFLASDAGQQITVPGDATAKAYSSSAPNSSGDYVAHYMTTVGNIDLEVHYASQGSLQEQNFQQWAGTEYASVKTSAAPAPDPSPTPTTFQKATCPGSTLSNCLMTMPSGSVVLPGLPSTYTDDAYATANYLSAGVPSVEHTLSTDQVRSIISEAWGVDSFDQAAQVVVMQTRTDAQAQNLLSTLGGTTTTFPDSFTVPNYPAAEGSYTTVASDGIVEGLLQAQAGNVFVAMWFSYTGTFSIATSQAWAATELNLLNLHTQDHWGFPIPTVSTPALAPFAADPCTASTLSGCLMALPSGAKPNTSAAGANPQDPGVDGFVDALYPDRSNYEETWLNTDGATDAASESWTAPDGASATDYLLRFGSGRAAQAAALQEAGDDLAGSQSCTAASLPNTYCVVLPENDSTGAVPLWVFGWGSKYGFALEVTKADSADTADALKWAETQAELLAG